jgi:hypothetical protein
VAAARNTDSTTMNIADFTIPPPDWSSPMTIAGQMAAEWEMLDGTRYPVANFPDPVVVGEQLTVAMPDGPRPQRLVLLIWDQPFMWLDVPSHAAPGDTISYGAITLA